MSAGSLHRKHVGIPLNVQAVLQVGVTLVAAASAVLICDATSKLPLTYTAGALGLIFVLAQLLVGAFRVESEFEIIDRAARPILLSGFIGAAVSGLLAAFVLQSRPLMDAAIVAGFITTVLVLGLRLFALFIAKRSQGKRRSTVPVIIVGSGDAAASFVRLINENHNFAYTVAGCVDDEPLSWVVNGSPIIGRIDDLPNLIAKHRAGSIIIAIPAVSAQLIKRIMNCCLEAKGHEGRAPSVKILPGVMELLHDGVKISRIRTVQPEDLLPRDPVKVDLQEIVPHVENRVILVTGAGGSIGSELCRQIVGLNPSLLLLLGHGENSLFSIDEELRLRFRFHRTKIILADVADAARIRNVFSEYRPHVVFHAAAHKHVPIVEANICESVRNNVLGTHVVALAAAAAGAAKFVLLSTDKAVNPTSVMGATKRMSEIISQSFVNQTGTEFVTVRFGNVLESRGSVIPIFKKQIENGGPVTITHKDMQRYFMTIPEAVSLVLQGMAMGRDGQVLVLDMGKPVNILSLAKTLITLSGLTPYRDVDIVETGIRPGEKLFEEILTSHEGLSTTNHARLFIAQQERVAYETLALGLAALDSGVRAGDKLLLIDVLRNFVPSFQPGPHLAADSLDGAAALAQGRQYIPSSNGHGSKQDEDGQSEEPAAQAPALELQATHIATAGVMGS